MDDLVLKETVVTTTEEEKLGLRWEGTYVVTNSYRPGAYCFKDATGHELPHPWKAEHLRRYYI